MAGGGGRGSPFFLAGSVPGGRGWGFGGPCMEEKWDINRPDFFPQKILIYLQIVKYLIPNP